MPALVTVQDYITAARTLLQDEVNAPYRYSDFELVLALNLSFLEMRRLRPDMFVQGRATPAYAADTLSAIVDLDEQYRVAALYYICGHAQLRDEEGTEDARASGFINKFTGQMLSVVS